MMSLWNIILVIYIAPGGLTYPHLVKEFFKFVKTLEANTLIAFTSFNPLNDMQTRRNINNGYRTGDHTFFTHHNASVNLDLSFKNETRELLFNAARLGH